jgi:hypothetical protein
MLKFMVQWIIFLGLNGLVGIIAALWSLWEHRVIRSLSSFIAHWITFYLGIIIGVEMALGLIGGLTVSNLLLCLGLILIVSLWVARSTNRIPICTFLNWRPSLHVTKTLTDYGLTTTIFFAMWLALGLIVAVLAEPSTMIDSLTYHLPMPVNWLQNARISPFYLPFSDIANSYFPSNGELLNFWVMAPFCNDLLVRLVNVGLWGVLMLALYRLNRKMEVPPQIALGALLFFAFTPLVLSQTADLTLDMAALAVFLLALGHLFEFARSLRTYDLGLFSIASGIFLGIKYSGPAYLLLLLLAWSLIVVWKRCEYTWKKLLYHSLLIAIGIGSLGGYWYLRNFLLTGNPIFPLKFSVLGFTVFPGMVSNANYHYVTLGKNFSLDTMIKLAETWVWSYGGILLILSLPALCYLLTLFYRLRKRFLTENNFEFTLCDIRFVILVILNLGGLLLYLRTPYSIMRFTQDTPITTQNLIWGARFGLTTSAIGVILLTQGWKQTSHSKFFVLSLPISIVQGLLAGYHLSSYHFIVFAQPFSVFRLWMAFLILLLLASMGFLLQKIWYIKNYRALIFISMAIISLGLTGVGFYKVYQYRESHRYSVYLREYGSVAEGWRWIAENVTNSNIAYSGALPLNYPLYGPDLSNKVRYINLSDDLDDRFHDFWAKDIHWRAIDYENWRRNLSIWETDYLVISLKTPVIETEWAASHPEYFTLVFSNEAIQIYRIQL